MEISTIFFIFLFVALCGIVAALFNFARALKGADMHGAFVAQIIISIVYVIGLVGSFITGIIWLVQYCKH